MLESTSPTVPNPETPLFNRHLTLSSLPNPEKIQAIDELFRDLQQRRIDELAPDWVDSVLFKWKGDTLKVHIYLERRALAGEVPSFITALKEDANAPIEFTVSPGLEMLKRIGSRNLNKNSRARYLRMIDMSLPYGFEIHRLRHYREKHQGKDGEEVFEYLVPEISGVPGREKDLESWRLQFQDNYGVEVFPRQDWVSGGMRSILRKNMGIPSGEKARLMDLRDVPLVRGSLIGSFNGSASKNQLKEYPWKVDLSNLQDLTGGEYTWITKDGRETVNREDILSARMQPNGHLEILIGIVDPTEYAYPGSLEDARVQRGGLTVYARYHRVPTLSPRIAYDKASFRRGRVRRAAVAKFVFDEDLKPLSEEPEMIWAKVKSIGNIPPDMTESIIRADKPLEDIRELLGRDATTDEATRARSSLYWMATLLPAMKRLVHVDHSPQEMKGRGLGFDIVRYTMTAFKYRVPLWLRERGREFIASNQGPADQKYVDIMKSELSVHGIPFDETYISDPHKFRELRKVLHERKLYRTADKLIDGRLGKTTFSPISRGRKGKGLEHYGNFKARMSDGLTNFQILIAALNDSPPPYTFSELCKRARNSERQNNAYNKKTLLLNRYGALLHRLRQSGGLFPYTVEHRYKSDIEINVPGNKQRCVLRNFTESDLHSQRARMIGYDVDEECYVFEPA